MIHDGKMGGCRWDGRRWAFCFVGVHLVDAGVLLVVFEAVRYPGGCFVMSFFFF